MLVLTLNRRGCPGVTITDEDGNEQRVDLLEVAGDKVKIGLSFDKKYKIVRDGVKPRRDLEGGPK